MKRLLLGFVLVFVISSNSFAAERLRIAVGNTFKPYAFVNENGITVGYDIDVITLLLRETGYEAMLDEVAFQAMLPGISAGTYDAAIYAITPTKERAKKVNFTDTYGESNSFNVILVRKDSKVKSLGDLKDKKVGVNTGTVQHDWATDNLKTSKIMLFDTYDVQFMALKAKKIDAILIEENVAKEWIKDNKEGALISDFRSPIPGSAIAVRKENTALLESFNAALLRIKSDGRLAEIGKKWF